MRTTLCHKNSKTLSLYFIRDAVKICLLVTHLYLMINGISYKLSEVPEIKSNINNRLKILMVQKI